ncbi:hypothetical protein DDZ13_02145 [Coraliomargarita sinensis]|uniref:TonB C-terminal domain-containing protein n=1 Tax=Coraliomargarita sinensis TaxID=2174842 RepID=A0A317ZJ93_9BACT|nr:hypothetical protein [Coraliomargarita sinensis]PXA05695.1 hypothetical protein DDZ13_02145 [Coraliomargarita sinensis]
MSHQFEQTGEVRNSRHISPLLKTALLLGVLVHLAGFFMFRVISSPLPSREESTAFISLVPTEVEGDEAELVEQASLFDSAPLFVPGEWSSASGVFSSKILRNWQVFPDYEPDIELMAEVKPDRLSLQQATEVREPMDLLALRFWDMFSYFGQGGIEAEAPERWASVAVATIISGNSAYPQDFNLRIKADLPSGEFAERPVVFYVNMTAPGLLTGAPVLRQSSGSADLDAEAVAWLKQAKILAQLPAGFVELRIFP